MFSISRIELSQPVHLQTSCDYQQNNIKSEFVSLTPRANKAGAFETEPLGILRDNIIEPEKIVSSVGGNQMAVIRV